MNAKHLIITAMLLALSGCASTQSSRTLATSTGLYVGSLNEGTAAFVEDQNVLNAANAAHLDRLAAYERPDRVNITRQRLSWTVTGERDKLAALDSATSVSSDAILAQMAPTVSDPLRVANTTGTNYDAALKRLGELSRKPKPLDLFKGALAYLGKVKESYDKLADDAAKAAEASTTNTTAADTAAAPSTASPGK